MPQLAIDIGGTKTLATLVDGASVTAETEIATPRHDSAGHWCSALASLVADWRGRYDCAGLAVTGLVDTGEWSALNPAILPVPDHFPLERALQHHLHVPVQAMNDAHAAAWGEFRFGAGNGRDLVYLTVSTGIGGGAVTAGRLLRGRRGLALSVGQLRLLTEDSTTRIEDLASGLWMSAEAARAGQDALPKAIFESARAGKTWAKSIVELSAGRVAQLCHNLQLLLAPDVIVIGGGIGLADGFIPQVRSWLADLPPVERPEILASGLGKYAGVIGAADHARLSLNTGGGNA